MLVGAMSLPLRAVVSVLAVAASAVPLGAQNSIHSRANVNDPVSHGKIGDGKLSLNEAIQLHNGTLPRSRLSALEQAQLVGSLDISIVDVDAKVTPTITVERDLDVVIDTAHGFNLDGQNGRVRIDLGRTRGILATSDFCSFRRLRVQGGQHGIAITQNDTLFGASVEDVDFSGQSIAGFRFSTA